MESIEDKTEHPVPIVVIETVTSVLNMDIKMHVLSSYLRFRSGDPSAPYRWQTPGGEQVLLCEKELIEILSYFSERHKADFNEHYEHREGVAFLYSCAGGGRKQSVNVGVDLELIRKTKTWQNENPMVDSWTFEYPFNFGLQRGVSLARQDGVMCSFEAIVLGRELESKMKSKNRDDFLSRFPDLPTAFRSKNLIQKPKARVQV